MAVVDLAVVAALAAAADSVAVDEEALAEAVTVLVAARAALAEVPVTVSGAAAVVRQAEAIAAPVVLVPADSIRALRAAPAAWARADEAAPTWEESAVGGLADRASVARVRVDSVPGDLAAPAWAA